MVTIVSNCGALIRSPGPPAAKGVWPPKEGTGAGAAVLPRLLGQLRKIGSEILLWMRDGNVRRLGTKLAIDLLCLDIRLKAIEGGGEPHPHGQRESRRGEGRSINSAGRRRRGQNLGLGNKPYADGPGTPPARRMMGTWRPRRTTSPVLLFLVRYTCTAVYHLFFFRRTAVCHLLPIFDRYVLSDSCFRHHHLVGGGSLLSCLALTSPCFIFLLTTTSAAVRRHKDTMVYHLSLFVETEEWRLLPEYLHTISGLETGNFRARWY